LILVQILMGIVGLKHSPNFSQRLFKSEQNHIAAASRGMLRGHIAPSMLCRRLGFIGEKSPARGSVGALEMEKLTICR